MVKIFILLIGIGLFFWGVLCLMTGIINTWYFAEFRIGIVVGVIFIPIGIYVIRLSFQLEVKERERKKQEEIEKQRQRIRDDQYATDLRKQRFMEQDQWKRESSETPVIKYCSTCGNIIEPNENFCKECGIRT